MAQFSGGLDPTVIYYKDAADAVIQVKEAVSRGATIFYGAIPSSVLLAIQPIASENTDLLFVSTYSTVSSTILADTVNIVRLPTTDEANASRFASMLQPIVANRTIFILHDPESAWAILMTTIIENAMPSSTTLILASSETVPSALITDETATVGSPVLILLTEHMNGEETPVLGLGIKGYTVIVGDSAAFTTSTAMTNLVKNNTIYGMTSIVSRTAWETMCDATDMILPVPITDLLVAASIGVAAANTGHPGQTGAIIGAEMGLTDNVGESKARSLILPIFTDVRSSIYNSASDVATPGEVSSAWWMINQMQREVAFRPSSMATKVNVECNSCLKSDMAVPLTQEELYPIIVNVWDRDSYLGEFSDVSNIAIRGQYIWELDTTTLNKEGPYVVVNVYTRLGFLHMGQLNISVNWESIEPANSTVHGWISVNTDITDVVIVLREYDTITNQSTPYIVMLDESLQHEIIIDTNSIQRNVFGPVINTNEA